MSGLQTTSNSNDALPLRSVPRTGCVGHCGNPRLKGGRSQERGEKKEHERQLAEFSDGFGRVKQLTANSSILRLGYEEVSDAARCKERPQRPKDLCEKNGKQGEYKDTNRASDHGCNKHYPAVKILELTGVDHLRRPKNAMDVLRGCECVRMSELSSTVSGWDAGVGNLGADAAGGIPGPRCAVEPWIPMLSPSTPSKPTAAASTTFAPGVSPLNSFCTAL